MSEQVEPGPDRLKKPRTGPVGTGWLGPNWLKKPGARSAKDLEGCWKDNPLRNVFGS